ncbi:MAG: LLM class flavin-dependent oxidoreductase [Chloroflexota bacterium]
MRFSLRLNNDQPVSTYIQLAKLAEEVGFDQFWISNDLFLRSAAAILPAVALATKRIEIGSCIFNPYTINPAEIAMFAATMDELSGNRFNLGLSAGASDFLHWVGLEQQRPLTAVRDTIIAIRALLAGERTTVPSHFLPWNEEAYLRFEAPRVTPIYIGALGPKMLQLSGELADGVLPLLFPPEHYFGVEPLVAQGLANRPSKLSALDFAACIWVSLADDASAARQVLAEKVAYYGYALSPLILERLGLTVSDFDDVRQAVVDENNLAKAATLVDDRMLKIGVMGQPSDLIKRLEPLVDAGVTHLSFGPPLGPNLEKAVYLLGDVITYFKGNVLSS